MGVRAEELVVERPASGAPEPSEPPRRRLLGPALLVLAAVLFLGFGWRTVTAPFGNSHDGRNAGVWASGSRALREAGPVESRLGTRSPENGTYANHPPLIFVETAVAEAVAGERTPASRAPAWLGSLLAIFLAGLLLRERGLRPGAAGLAVLLTVVTPMFLVYGTMLDTPVTSLPVGIGLLVLWERNRRGAPVRPAVAGAVAALAVLSGWLGLSLAALVGGWAVLRLVRRRSGRRPVDAAFAAGAVAGAGLLLAWLLWAFGGTLAPLLDQFVSRTGQASSEPVGLGPWAAAQREFLPGMFGPIGLLALGGLVVALRDARTRGLAAVVLAVTVPYQLLFRSAATNHEYWGYWLVLPVAVGLAAGFDLVLRWWVSRGRAEAVPVVALAAVVALYVGAAWARPWAPESRKLDGTDVAAVIELARLEPGQATAWYTGAVGEPAGWLAYALRRPATVVPASGYDALAERSPADLVLVGEVRCLDGVDRRTYELRPAASLVERPPVLQSCPATRSQPGARAGR